MNQSFSKIARLFVCLGIVVGIATSSSSQGPPQNPPPTTPPQTTSGTGGQGTNNPPKATSVDVAKGQLQSTQSSPAQAGKQLTIDPINQKSVQAKTQVVFTPNVRDPQGQSTAGYTYYIYGAPSGAYMDPNTGKFTWTPQQPGNYSFFVGAADNANPLQRFVWVQATIEVTPPLQVFGYDLFVRARAIIDARMLILKLGVSPANVLSLAQQAANGTSILPVTQGPVPGTNPLDAYQFYNEGAGANGTNPFVPSTSFTNPQNPSGYQNGPTIPGPGGGTAVPGMNNQPPSQYQPLAGLFGQTNQQNQQNQQPGNQGANPSQYPNNAQNGTQYPQQGTGSNPPYNPMSGNAGLQGFGNQQLPTTPGVPTIQPSPQLTPQLIDQLRGLVQAQINGSVNNAQIISAVQNMVGPLDQASFNVYVPSPERYQLGPGDLLTIRIWSPTMAASDYDVKVDPQGRITIPQGNQQVVVRGQDLAHVETHLRQIIRGLIRDGDVSVSLKALRTMSITVMGEAYMPGNYEVPAVSTLFNALYVFGGPNSNGSLRQIELRRTDGTRHILDLYGWLIRGDKTGDVPLQPGDVIYIPAERERVTVQGEVMKEAIYEVLPNEHLHDVIAFAGGAKPTGVTQRISLETVQPGVGRVLKDIPLESPEAFSTLVYDGDVITISSIRNEFTNKLEIEGNVDQPGEYAWVQGITVADLIQRARGVLKDTHMDRADLLRENPDKSQALVRIDLTKALARQAGENPELKPNDRIVVYSEKDTRWMGTRQVNIQGAVQKPGMYYRYDGMHVADLLLQAGGLAQDAAKNPGFLQRHNPDGTAGPLVNIDFMKMAVGDPTNNPELQDQDVLTVKTVKELNPIPEESVNILGAVQRPGRYDWSTNMTLRDLLNLSGNLMFNAGRTIEITNARVPQTTARTVVSAADVMAGSASANVLLKPGDLVSIPFDSSISATVKKVMIIGAVAKPGPYPVNGLDDRLSALVQRAGGLLPNAFPEGAEFFRQPDLLRTDLQQIMDPKIQAAMDIVNKDQYIRELARTEVARIEQTNTVKPTTTIPLLPGLTPSASTAQNNIPPNPAGLGPLVTPARELTDELVGNINVNLAEAIRRRDSYNNVVLQDGDIIEIPPRPINVVISGAVVVPSAVLYVPNRTVAYYVNRSGGFADDAARDRLLIVRPGGPIIRAEMRTPIKLGDQIWVPTKVMAASLGNKEAIQNATSVVSAGAIVLGLIRSLFR